MILWRSLIGARARRHERRNVAPKKYWIFFGTLAVRSAEAVDWSVRKLENPPCARVRAGVAVLLLQRSLWRAERTEDANGNSRPAAVAGRS